MRNSVKRLLLAALVASLAGPAMADDQQVAEQIAKGLRTSGQLKDYSVGVKYKDGTAWLKGRVTSRQQQAAAVAVAKKSPGVKKVVSDLTVAPAPRAAMPQGVQQTSGYQPIPGAAGPMAGPQMGMPPGAQMGMPPGAQMAMPHPMAQGDYSAAEYGGMQGMPGGGGPLPMYAGAAGGPAPAVYDQPSLPNYAWPSYAAYPNYGALTYPKQYSPTAWPYIGPFYPYPQVPLGWRKVTLEWDDGWWMLDFKD